MREKLPVTIKIGNKEYKLNYEEELKCAEDTINQNLIEQASLFAWYAVLSELAAEDMAQKKLELDMLEGRLFTKYKTEEDKVTDRSAESKMRQDEDYMAGVLMLNEAKKYVGVLKAIKDAFGQRKDMVFSLAANMRAQADPVLMLKKQEAKEKE